LIGVPAKARPHGRVFCLCGYRPFAQQNALSTRLHAWPAAPPDFLRRAGDNICCRFDTTAPRQRPQAVRLPGGATENADGYPYDVDRDCKRKRRRVDFTALGIPPIFSKRAMLQRIKQGIRRPANDALRHEEPNRTSSADRPHDSGDAADLSIMGHSNYAKPAPDKRNRSGTRRSHSIIKRRKNRRKNCYSQ
jgi:hypothetical protein